MGVVIFAIVIFYAIFAFKRFIKQYFARPTFDGKVIFVTGASSGIGKELSIQLSQLDAYLILCSRNVEELEKLKCICKDPKKVDILQIDISQPLEAQKILEKYLMNFEDQKIFNEKSFIDIFVQNAGVAMRVPFKEFSYENHEYMTNLNYNGPVALTKPILAHFLKKEKKDNFRGQFVIISSISALLHAALRTSYSGSKAAISAFYNSLRTELFDEGIHVTQIHPGYVKTNVSINSLAAQPMQRLGKTDANIQNGMSVEKCCRETILSMYWKEQELVISKQFMSKIMVMMRYLTPDFVSSLMIKNGKQQIEALKKAQ